MFLSKVCELLHSCFLQSILVHRSSLIKPQTVTQFSSLCEVLGLPLCFSGSSFHIIWLSLNVLHHTDTSPLVRKRFGRIYSLICNESHSHSLLLLCKNLTAEQTSNFEQFSNTPAILFVSKA
jgi:hypothetical protein